jgi:hypothetical protein
VAESVRRWWRHRLYAWVARYCWFTCPSCGGEFGGHEVAEPAGPRMSTAWTTSILCPTCTRDGVDHD